ncbi:sensor histidine kinase [Nitrincola tapanii]|uniref:sensor histidine kinase n=1 Tax=Nitrincola tapanii TaxID=1708751 RepID=UPI001F38CE30|nr:sensor histidine kinase [Nitrincola tapanii]
MRATYFTNLNPARWSLLRRIMVLLVLGLGLTVGISFWIISSSLNTELRREYFAHERQSLENTAHRIEQRFKQRAQFLQQLAPLITNGQTLLPADELERVLRVAYESNLFSDFILMDTEARGIFDYPFLPERRGKDFSHRPFINELMQNWQSVISPPLMGSVSGLPSVFMAEPVFNQAGQPIAILVGRNGLESEMLFQRIRNELQSYSGQLLIIDPTYDLYITATDEEKVLQPLSKEDRIYLSSDELQDTWQGFYQDKDRKNWLYVAHKLGFMDWIVIKKAPEVIVLASIQQALTYYMLMIASLLIPLAFIMVVLIYRWLAPLRSSIVQLNKAVEEESDISKFNIEREDEIGQLLLAFNAFQSIRDRQQQLKDELLSVVSHELRTPLTSIRGALNILQLDQVQQDPEHRKKLFNLASRNLNRLTFLVNDLLDVVSLSKGMLRLNLSDCSAQEAILEVLEDFRALLEEKSLQVEFTATEEMKVHVDQLRLQQVLSNLISNAIKFSNAGSRIQIALTQQGEFVRISVLDEGEGIPMAFQPHVFERFTQADLSDRRKQSGTGLGMAIAFELVEAMGGHLSFDSVPGQGACFYVDLPSVKVMPDDTNKALK